MNTVTEITRGSGTDVRQHARHQVIGLSAQFLLGMLIYIGFLVQATRLSD